MKIGVFDSGKGGEFIADGLRRILPHHDYVVINDREHVPYGSRTNEEIIELTDAALQPLYATCPIIVIACNTATMAAITALRIRHPDTLFIGTEPMIKPAEGLSQNRHITVLATPLTLASERYHILKQSYGSGLIIDEPSTNHWAKYIEYGEIDHIDMQQLHESISSGSDTIVLACTHYIALKNQLEITFPAATILEPTDAIARQIERLNAQIR
jgi:glutamate racemase